MALELHLEHEVGLKEAFLQRLLLLNLSVLPSSARKVLSHKAPEPSKYAWNKLGSHARATRLSHFGGRDLDRHASRMSQTVSSSIKRATLARRGPLTDP